VCWPPRQRPDHATIARFVERNQEAIAGLFGEVLTLCARSGVVKVGVIAVDGTKVQANASRNENLGYGQLAREILEEAKAVDAAEDELYGEARGDELPPKFATAQGRRGWLGEAKQRLEAERAANPQPVPRSRRKRVREAKRRLEEELWTEVRANRPYEAYRARGRIKDRRRFGRATNEHQVVLAAEIETVGADFGHVEPMLDAAQRELAAAGIRPVVTLASNRGTLRTTRRAADPVPLTDWLGDAGLGA
jgi:hypothetical protein